MYSPVASTVVQQELVVRFCQKDLIYKKFLTKHLVELKVYWIVFF